MHPGRAEIYCLQRAIKKFCRLIKSVRLNIQSTLMCTRTAVIHAVETVRMPCRLTNICLKRLEEGTSKSSSNLYVYFLWIAKFAASKSKSLTAPSNILWNLPGSLSLYFFCKLHLYSTYSGGQNYLDTLIFPIDAYSKQVMQNWVLC